MQRLLGRWLSSATSAVSGGGGGCSRAAATATTAAAAAATLSPARLRYVLSTFRFHNDVRPPSRVVVLHDYLANASEWQEALHGSVHTPRSTRASSEGAVTAACADDDGGEVCLQQQQQQQRRRDELLLMLYPLEVYCVDLRGHALSERVAPVAPLLLPPSNNNNNNNNEGTGDDGAAYTLACAADVTRMRQSVCASHATTLCGVGYGAMVACQAALQQPDAYESMCLVVHSLSQLWRCSPTSYAARALLCGAPRRARTLTELHDYLACATTTAATTDAARCAPLSPAAQRVLLSAAELCRDEAGEAFVRLRYDDALLQRTQPLCAHALLQQQQHKTASSSCASTYTGPVYVLVTGSNDGSNKSTPHAAANDGVTDDDAQALQLLQRHFPRAKVVYAHAARTRQHHGQHAPLLCGEYDTEEALRAAAMRAAVVPRARVCDTAATLDALQPFLTSGDEELIEQLCSSLTAWDA